YPITPASPMGELADAWSAVGEDNIWGSKPLVVQMQSEGGAAGAVHGALQTGSLTTTFTSSQGLLLMIPNMYKIAGELTSTVFHIAARSLASQGLSIFGDHSDVMAARGTGWGMLFANSVQECQDFALIAQAAALKSRVPFLHIFDGFRTSHEINKIEQLDDDDIRALIDDDAVRAHRSRALSPDRPFIRGTAQNPDVYFQARETVNPFYTATPGIVEEVMEQFAARTGRRYGLFDYSGAPDAERVIVLMGSGAETVEETINWLVAQGEKVGLVKVRLFRPFSVEHFFAALPATVRSVAVLDRTKEPGSAGEPLYQDVLTAIAETDTQYAIRNTPPPRVFGGRYGLSSKEFTPAMVKAVFDEAAKARPKNHFTIGIFDDVSHTSLDFDPEFDIEPDNVVRAVFWGLGSDGTVSANKNSIKIIGEETDNFAQGYFVYDSKKSGARTVSHLRFGPKPIQSAYLIRQANFVAVHQFGFLRRYDVLGLAEEGATVLLNAPYPPQEVWEQLPRMVQEQIIRKKLKLYNIDAYALAAELNLGVRINTIMQAGFFAISGVLPQDEAIARIKEAIRKSYGKRGETIVKRNFAAVDAAVAHLHRIPVPAQAESRLEMLPPVPGTAPTFVQNVTAQMIAGNGDLLPVSALPNDGAWPSATTRWEKRNIALEAPVWDPDVCIQCGKCVLVCPHAVIRAKVAAPEAFAHAPEGFLTSPARWREMDGLQYTLQVAIEDCTGCSLCVEVCPAKNKSAVGRKAVNMEVQPPLLEKGQRDWEFFLGLPEFDRTGQVCTNGHGKVTVDALVSTGSTDGAHPSIHFTNVKNIQLLQPLFEFSGACAGCGETPYLKLISQLYGDRTIIANATGCSSIYGGNLPTTPWATNADGRGPAWSNSLFEDNAEFGLGMRLTLEKQQAYAIELLERLRAYIGDDLAGDLIAGAGQSDEEGIQAQRLRVEELKGTLHGLLSLTPSPAVAAAEWKRIEFTAKDLLSLADVLVHKIVWIVGGDGWAYDIGYGGLDHVLASGRNVNILVMDTEVYSNTGGQSSKATPLG
ncbi:MAG: pyruvate:ferredoxin (flavodoxin) oxidoreductase, partial [Chloroflexi bacterium]|nr:pyruvate:ferredoxin (flavodoxin) oxidoreductase [Chloroflexota bacterium]